LILSGLKKGILIADCGVVITIADVRISDRSVACLRLNGFDDAHNHHQVEQPMLGPTPEPANSPLAELRADRNWAAQGQVFGFESHE
jgi:hypothetical protein